MDRVAKIRGAIVGHLIGDALGVPYEFQGPDSLPPLADIEMSPPPGYRRTHQVPPGTWSDDGAQALCLLESLLECGRFNAEDFACRMLRWLTEGHMAVDGKVFDVGRQTISALQSKLRDGDPLSVPPGGEHTNGNGALMRVLPLALLHHGDDAEMVRDAHRQAELTHPHVRSRVACALYSMWARVELETTGVLDTWALAYERLRQVYALVAASVQEATLLTELEQHFGADCRWQPRGTGYVVDSLHTVRAACVEASYERIVRRAISYGNDTDTTACLAGGIAGIRYATHGIPERWLGQLRGRELLEPLLERIH